MQPSIVYRFVDIIFWLYMMMLFVRIIGSWFAEIQETKAFRFIQFYTDPYLNIFKRIIPPIGMMDISPIAAFFALKFLEMIVKSLIV
jgi:YggT family protein